MVQEPGGLKSNNWTGNTKGCIKKSQDANKHLTNGQTNNLKVLRDDLSNLKKSQEISKRQYDAIIGGRNKQGKHKHNLNASMAFNPIDLPMMQG